jgi:(S)-ureidoglycine aminohydrolase
MLSRYTLKEESMLHHLGATRSSLKADHLLQTPDTFIRTPLPGAENVDFVVHAGPRLGANFTMMTAEFRLGGRLPVLAPGVQRFVYVLEGELELDRPFETTMLGPNGFAYLPPNTPHAFEAKTVARAVVIEKSYQPQTGSRKPNVSFGQEQDLPAEPLGGDPSLLVKRMMPDEVPYDFAVNTMTYDPGASLAMVEVHIMEHGLLMLEGSGIYKLGDSWYPVTAGDFIWMAPYCPQWFGALGKAPAKYLIYKDWYRHPLAE